MIQAEYRTFDASDGEPAQLIETSDPNALVLQGIKLESINWTSPLRSTNDEVVLLHCSKGCYRSFIPLNTPLSTNL
jgi:hypothetical protein